jgi:oligosaccharide translocation protein RFT1
MTAAAAADGATDGATDGVATRSAFSNVRSLFAFNLLQKLVSFALNQALINLTTPEVMGMAAVQLELLLSTLLFLSREGIRLAAIRSTIDTSEQFHRLVNLSCIPCILISLAVMVLVSALVAGYEFQRFDLLTVLLYCLGAWLEALGEPMYNSFQNSLQLGPQMKAETMAVFSRSVVTVFCVAYLQLGVRGFGIAQCSYGLIYFMTLLSCLRSTPLHGRIRAPVEFIPQRIRITSSTGNAGDPSAAVSANPTISLLAQYVEPQIVTIAVTAMGSSLLKHLLTEADKITLSLLVSNYSQGIFAVANNYGSLVARLLYLPVENASRLAFSKFAADIAKNADAVRTIISRSSTQVDSSTERALSAEMDSQMITMRLKTHEMKSILSRLVVAVALFGCIFPLFGLPYISVVVNILLSSTWRTPETIRTLRSYCVYLLVLGVNGISEAFVQSVASPSAFVQLNMGLCASTVVYVGVAFVLVNRLGTSGLVWANIASMSCRILFNAYFIHTYFEYPRRNYLQLTLEDPLTPNAMVATALKSGMGSLARSPIKDIFNSLNSEKRSKDSQNTILIKYFLLFCVLCASVACMHWSARRFDESLAVAGRIMLRRLMEHVGVGALAFALTLGSFVMALSKAEILKTFKLLSGKNV